MDLANILAPSLRTIAVLVGAGVILWTLWRVFDFLVFHFVPTRDPLGRYRSKEEKAWAVVTGASAGIGFGYAEELVSRGFGVIILAHIQAELDDAVKQLKRLRADADVRTVLCDATIVSNDELRKIVDRVQTLPITILINNVGGSPISGEKLREFSSYSAEDIDYSINMNARFMAQLTRLMLPVLSRNPRSLILNMSSGAAEGMPYLALYSPTKAFNKAFGRAVAREFGFLKVPVDCLTILPGDVRSQGNMASMGWGTPSSREFARMALDRVDKAVDRNLVEIVPYWLHAIQIMSLGLLTEATLRSTTGDIMQKKREAQARLK